MKKIYEKPQEYLPLLYTVGMLQMRNIKSVATLTNINKDSAYI